MWKITQTNFMIILDQREREREWGRGEKKENSTTPANGIICLMLDFGLIIYLCISNIFYILNEILFDKLCFFYGSQY